MREDTEARGRNTAAGVGVPEADAHAGTRNKVARSILVHGPSTAADLAERLDLTAAAVRRHLDALLADGVIEAGSRDIDDGIEWLRHQALHAVDARGFTGLPRRVLKKVPRGTDDRAILLLERQPLTSPERASEEFRGLSAQRSPRE